jgi:hypothetical protein
VLSRCRVSAARRRFGCVVHHPTCPGFEIKPLAIGLAAGIIFDATVIRALLVPSLMKLLGDANWWMPNWGRASPCASHARNRSRYQSRRSHPKGHNATWGHETGTCLPAAGRPAAFICRRMQPSAVGHADETKTLVGDD